MIHTNRPCTTHSTYLLPLQMCYQFGLKCGYYENYYRRLSIQIMQLWVLKYLCADEIPQMKKVPPVLLPAIDALHPAKDASVFNTIDGLGLRIGAKESIILLFHQYIFTLLSFESIINLSKLPLLIFNALVLFISKDL